MTERFARGGHRSHGERLASLRPPLQLTPGSNCPFSSPRLTASACVSGHASANCGAEAAPPRVQIWK